MRCDWITTATRRSISEDLWNYPTNSTDFSSTRSWMKVGEKLRRRKRKFLRRKPTMCIKATLTSIGDSAYYTCLPYMDWSIKRPDRRTAQKVIHSRAGCLKKDENINNVHLLPKKRYYLSELFLFIFFLIFRSFFMQTKAEKVHQAFFMHSV